MNDFPSMSLVAAYPAFKHPTSAAFVVKRVSGAYSTGKQKVLALETALERMKTMRHSNITSLIDFRLGQEREQWCFDIVSEKASKGSLADLLGTIEALASNRARLFGIDLLQGLDYLHKNGIVHGRLHTRNILLHGAKDGRATVKIADALYEDCVHDAIGLHMKQRSLQDDAADWLAPEVDRPEQVSKSRKFDIWAFGIVLLKMVRYYVLISSSALTHAS